MQFLSLQFRNNFHSQAILVTVTNVLTAVFAGFAIFAILGFMARNLDLPIAEVVQEGPGLAFIAYPEVHYIPSCPHLVTFCGCCCSYCYSCITTTIHPDVLRREFFYVYPRAMLFFAAPTT